MHRPLLALVAVALLAPAAASAAPNGTVSLANPSYSWTGGPGNGLFTMAFDQVDIGPVTADAAQCGKVPTETCTQTLIKVDDAGDLTVELHGDPGSPGADSGSFDLDLDLYLYASDAAGTVGEALGESTSVTADETVVLSPLEPGYYVARVVFYQAIQASYHAKATLTETVPFDPDAP
jgi:hypothetical protein